MSNLPSRCPACNEEVGASALYCGKCGQRLGMDAPPPPPQPGYSNMQYAQPYAVAPTRKGISTGCIVGIVLAVILPFFLLLLAIALPNYIKAKDNAKGAEVKANLHKIQLAVERFAVDHEGQYPNYLTGGEAKYSSNVTSNGGFIATTDCKKEKLSDMLLRLGYLDSYPTNPFTRDGHSIHQMQDFDNLDPLRNGTDGKGGEFGTRYGADCTTMGSVLAEMRFKFRGTDSDPSELSMPTYSNIVHPFWDCWQANRPEPFLPGQFFYKGNGLMEPLFKEGTDELDGNMFSPKEIDMYMLSGYGSIRTKGKDVIGEEPKAHFSVMINEKEKSTEFEPWTRSDNRGLGGSPYGRYSGGNEQEMWFGNQNGIRDSLILILIGPDDPICTGG